MSVKGHKEDCNCCVCKAMRHEPLSIEHKEAISSGVQKAYSNGKMNNRVFRKSRKGKTYEEIFGEVKAKEIKKKQSIAKENYSPWNKGKSGLQVAWNKGHGDGSKYPDEFNKDLKEQIRKRDNYTCQKCGMLQEVHINIYGKKLEVHHVDFDKENLRQDNLLTLCKRCHAKLIKSRFFMILGNIEYRKFKNINKQEGGACKCL